MGRPVRTRLWEERAKTDRPVRENKLSDRPENCTTVFAGNLSYEIDDDKVSAPHTAMSKLRSGRWRVWPRGDRKWPVGMCGGYDDDIIRPAQRKPGLGLFQRCPGYYDREQNFPSLHVPCGGQRVGSGVYAAWSLWTVRILSVTCFNEARR